MMPCKIKLISSVGTRGGRLSLSNQEHTNLFGYNKRWRLCHRNKNCQNLYNLSVAIILTFTSILAILICLISLLFGTFWLPMKDHKRKCFMCDSSSENPDITLHWFPKPGNNYLRCELWAKFCFPHGQWSSPDSQMKFYNEHRCCALTQIKESSYVDFTTKKLRRHAAPEENFVQITQTLPHHSNEPVAGLARQWALSDDTNQAQSTRKRNEGDYDKINKHFRVPY